MQYKYEEYELKEGKLNFVPQRERKRLHATRKQQAEE